MWWLQAKPFDGCIIQIKIAGGYSLKKRKEKKIPNVGAFTIEFIQPGALIIVNVSPIYLFFQDTVQTGRIQNGMKNEPGEVESWALFNVCKQSESNWSSGKGEVFKCDQNE